MFNKLGDLYLKANDVQKAVETYERAADLYQKAGFPNNAIALCNKILRNAPSRTNVYLKLAKLMLERGFAAEAKQNLLEYADRMQKAGQLDQAFGALKEFADLSPENEELRLLLAEQLKAAARTEEAREQLAKLYAEAEAADATKARQTLTRLKAIDPAFDPDSAPKPKVKTRPQKSTDLVFLDLDDDGPGAAASAPAAVTEPAEPDDLTVEPTALAGELDAEPDVEELEIQPTAIAELQAPEPEAIAPVETQEVELERASAAYRAMKDDLMLDGLETTALDDSLEPGAQAAEAAPGAAEEVEAPGDVEFLDLGVDEEQPQEVPLLDLGVDEEAPAAPVESPEELPELDLRGFDGAGAAAEAAAPVSLGELEERVADNPADAGAHRALGEALIEQGDRERGLEELDHALSAAEAAHDWAEAETVADEIIRLDPNSVRHHQKRVEFAYRRNDKSRLVRAYLGLADALFRQGMMERARAVYQRVLEHDPENESAQMALATLEPAAEEVQDAEPAGVAGAAAGGGRASAGGGEFVDLGALILEDELEVKDTRMRVEEEEPTGDEARDFADILAQFKKGIEASVAEEDWQAHYDLGVAFKEMGLLDEAIAEFQKALRAAEGRLKSAEALGVCFFEKGQFSVASTVLRRAIESDPRGDEQKIGLLYWVGRAEQEQGRVQQALDYYQRVFAIDIKFQDVSDRVKSLANAAR